MPGRWVSGSLETALRWDRTMGKDRRSGVGNGLVRVRDPRRQLENTPTRPSKRTPTLHRFTPGPGLHGFLLGFQPQPLLRSRSVHSPLL